MTVRADAIASDTIVRFRPALAYASPEMVSLAPGLTVVELRPIVNGELFVTCAAGATGAPPDDAASAAGAAARAVAAMAPIPASLRGEIREREWVNIGTPFGSVVGAFEGAFSVFRPRSQSLEALPCVSGYDTSRARATDVACPPRGTYSGGAQVS